MNLYKAVVTEVSNFVVSVQLAFDKAGNLHFTDGHANALYRLSPTGALQELAGFAPTFGVGDNGPALAAGLSAPRGLGFLPDGSLLIADYGNSRIRRLSPSRVITTIAGTGTPGGGTSGPAKSLDLTPVEQAVSDAAGNVYIGSYNLLRINPAGALSVFNTIGPKTLAFDAQGNLYGAGVPREPGGGLKRPTPPA